MKLLTKAWEHYQKKNVLPADPEHARSVFYAGMAAMRVLATESTMKQLKGIDDELDEWCRQEERKQKPH
jgi:hypothetical protein